MRRNRVGPRYKYGEVKHLTPLLIALVMCGFMAFAILALGLSLLPDSSPKLEFFGICSNISPEYSDENLCVQVENIGSKSIGGRIYPIGDDVSNADFIDIFPLDIVWESEEQEVRMVPRTNAEFINRLGEGDYRIYIWNRAHGGIANKSIHIRNCDGTLEFFLDGQYCD